MRNRNLLAVLAVLVGCQTAGITTAEDFGEVEVLMQVVPEVLVVTLSVSGPGILSDLHYDIPIDINGDASDVITIPRGLARRFLVEGFDSAGVASHSGEITTDVLRGLNPTINIVMKEIGSTIGVVIEAAMEVDVLLIDPANILTTVGSDTVLIDVLLDGSGGLGNRDSINVRALLVTWSIKNPAVASVDQFGTVTGIIADTTHLFGFVGDGSGFRIDSSTVTINP